MPLEIIESSAKRAKRPVYRVEKPMPGGGYRHLGILVWKGGAYQFKPTGWTKEDNGWMFTAADCIEIGKLCNEYTDKARAKSKKWETVTVPVT